jgi:hypothetical protein
MALALKVAPAAAVTTPTDIVAIEAIAVLATHHFHPLPVRGFGRQAVEGAVGSASGGWRWRARSRATMARATTVLKIHIAKAP